MREGIGFFFGCTVAVLLKELYEDLKRVLDKAQVEYEPLGVDQCCGIPLVLSGYIDEAKKHAGRIVEEIEGKDVDTLVTACPHCYIAFSKEYPETLGVRVPFRVQHFTQLADRLIDEKKIKVEKGVDLRVTYHDPCYLGRMGDRIYEEPRRIIRALPGVELKELSLNREDATCCGGGGLLRASFPILALEAAKEKIEMQLEPLGVDAVVSSCPFCYMNLREGLEMRERPLKVYNLEQLLARSLEGGVEGER
ncbi:MAG: (Fe-S)-binding protein [Candidatus Geothermarchaeales archaeon]